MSKNGPTELQCDQMREITRQVKGVLVEATETYGEHLTEVAWRASISNYCDSLPDDVFERFIRNMRSCRELIKKHKEEVL